jgi:hypothetical protein
MSQGSWAGAAVLGKRISYIRLQSVGALGTSQLHSPAYVGLCFIRNCSPAGRRASSAASSPNVLCYSPKTYFAIASLGPEFSLHVKKKRRPKSPRELSFNGWFRADAQVMFAMQFARRLVLDADAIAVQLTFAAAN